MALPDKLKQIHPTAANRIIFADATDWPAGGRDSWGDDDDQLDMTDVAAGAARQSDKFALPTNQELIYDVFLMLEFATAPVSGEVVDVYYGLSASATADQGNPGGLSGTDAAYTGTAGDSLDDSLKQLTYIGSMVCTADATSTTVPNQIQHIGSIPAPSLPRMMVVVDNNTSDAIHSDAVECAVMFVGREVQIQD